ncbi:GLE1 (YDL207W) [Zygosaccharomyces parabailii]|uniref:mRNA export factor GLE1 n=1 Tax=Zygosaccharomyces bailii (strain CLIB 213 / ATCC 58445 / CBS 680 / BCRC 21525 / NBRC 1098 / NCYC 1416 / NRRL Y-2227) TaxID=1333698 RepID=A0A8J2WVC1_ZYGB2|nr:GLE1 (YDL207W) [Zygosaccharomyces parabailii]CDF87803.1 BN860_14840g1_1 [Zygosaccharomyces bailii CLIB 213]CDH17863.1 related to Nucleoporin GLE1 [Zygosaccharomyces bailii ISA1307]
MRFVFDELYQFSDDEEKYENDESSPCSTPEPSPADFTFVNEVEEDIPRLKLPRQSSSVELVSEKLDPESEQLLSQLNLHSKLSFADELPIIIPNSRNNNNSMSRKPDISMAPQEAAYGTATLLSTLQESLASKMNKLEIDNRAQFQSVKRAKETAQEERRRKEEAELKRKKEMEIKEQEAREAQRRQLELERQQREEELRLKKERDEKERMAKKALEQEETRRRQAEEAKKLEEQAIRGKAVTDFKAIEKTFRHYKDKIASIKKDIVEPVKKMDVNMRNIISRHKRKINPKFGQLTNSNSQLQSIQGELFNLIDQTRENNLAYLWVLNFIAKALVHQSETEVRVKPQSALPLGRLALSLLIKYPELKELLMARWVKKCPFVIGYTCKIDTEQGRQNMGWKRSSDQKWEEDTSYDERMGGIVTLFAVMTRLPLPSEFINTTVHPLSISHSWHLLARISNTPTNLLTNTHFIVLGSWWDAAALQFYEAYGNQAAKLLQLVGDNLTSAVSEHKYAGAARLRILMEEWQLSGLQSFPEMAA